MTYMYLIHYIYQCFNTSMEIGKERYIFSGQKYSPPPNPWKYCTHHIIFYLVVSSVFVSVCLGCLLWPLWLHVYKYLVQNTNQQEHFDTSNKYICIAIVPTVFVTYLGNKVHLHMCYTQINRQWHKNNLHVSQINFKLVCMIYWWFSDDWFVIFYTKVTVILTVTQRWWPPLIVRL